MRKGLELWVGWSILVAVEYDPNAVLAALHNSFGEVWVNERLCYKDGKEVLRAFELVKFSSSDRFWQPEGQLGWQFALG